MSKWAGWGMAVALAGCAAVGGPDLVPGKSTAKEVTAAMGKPAMEAKRPNGETVQYFTSYPWGRSVKAATLGADGVLRSFEERLTRENINSVRAGMRDQQVRELLGPPRQITPDERNQLTVWEYPWVEAAKEKRIFWVSFSPDGVVRKVVEKHDEEAEPTSD